MGGRRRKRAKRSEELFWKGRAIKDWKQEEEGAWKSRPWEEGEEGGWKEKEQSAPKSSSWKERGIQDWKQEEDAWKKSSWSQAANEDWKRDWKSQGWQGEQESALEKDQAERVEKEQVEKKTDPSPRAEPPEAKPEPSPRAKPPEAKPMPKKQVEKDDGRSATPKRHELMNILNGLDHCLTVDGAEGMRSLAEKPSAQLCFYAHNEKITACTRLAITIGYMTSNARPKERHLCLRCAARKISEGNIDMYMDTDYDLSEPSHVATLEQQHSVVDMLEGCAAATPVVAPPPPPAAAPTVVAPPPPAAAPTLVAPPPPPRDIVDMQDVD